MPEKFEGNLTNGENPESKKFDVTKPLIVSSFDYDRGDFESEENKLFEFEGDPRYVVRIEDIEFLKTAFFKEASSPSEKMEKMRGLFDELKEKYGIVAPVDFAIVEGWEKKEPLLYIITDKVEGEHPEKLDFNSPDKEELIKKFEDFYVSLARYFIDKFKSDDLVLWDIAKSSAIKYGKKEGDVSPNLYVVDTDPKLTSGGSGIGDLTDMFSTIQMIESKGGRKFNLVRQELSDFLSQLDKEEVKPADRVSENYMKSVVGYIRAFLEEK